MKSTIYLTSLLIIGLFFANAKVSAVQAIRKPIEIKQPDGTKLVIRLFGDEFGSITTTNDGYLLKSDENGYYQYATKNTDGTVELSGIVAHNATDRTDADKRFLMNQPSGAAQTEVLKNAMLKGRMEATLKQLNSKAARVRNKTASTSDDIPPGLICNYPRTGSAKSLVVLVNFKDLAFESEHTAEAVSNMLNQKGYNLNGHQGSLRDYYQFNSSGLFNPEFVVVGPVTVSKNAVYYGGNNANGNDLHPEEMVREACILANPLVNYADFDADGDQVVDNIYVYYAGKGEADGGGDNTIWPHSYRLSYASMDTTLDGKQVDAYACSSELDGTTGKLDGIGVFAHEYGHILGLPDMYDVDYESFNGEAFDLNEWSLMASGVYNNNKATPPCLTIVERSILGWANPVAPDSGAVNSLPDMGKNNVGFRLSTKDSGEYYLLENRQQTENAWDSYIPYHGMLVYHVDMREHDSILLSYYGTPYKFSFAECWRYNILNVSSTHQCCDLVEADNARTFYTNSYATYLKGLKGDPFPGISGNTSFDDWSTPSSLTWNNSKLLAPLSEIKEENSLITFKYKDYSAIDSKPTLLAAKNIKPYSFQANWLSTHLADYYILSVFTRPDPSNQSLITYVDGYSQYQTPDTSLTVLVPNDNCVYYYTVKAHNPFAFSPQSDTISVSIPNGTPTALEATNVQSYSFQANWNYTNYASDYYLTAFSIDSLNGDTTYLEKNRKVSSNYYVINNLEDETVYWYQLRGGIENYRSEPSNTIRVETSKAGKISCYVTERVIWMKGMDKTGKMQIRMSNGVLIREVSANHTSIDIPGFYLVTAPYNGKNVTFKVLVQ